MQDLRLIATGDAIIARRLMMDMDEDSLALKGLIHTADAAFSNLEIMTPKAPWVPSSEYGGKHLATEPFVLDELQHLGFNLFNVANNHATDYTFQGLVDTMDELRKRSMVFAGGGLTLGEARAPAYLEICGRRVALIGAASTYVSGALAAETRTDVGGRPGVNPLRHETQFVLDEVRMARLKAIDAALGTADTTKRQRVFGIQPAPAEGIYRFLQSNFVEGKTPRVSSSANARDLEEICRWIKDARRQADLVLVSLHAHEGKFADGNSPELADFIVEAAHAVIDAGADVMIGHGPHVLRAIEIYKGKPIFYSLGNFIFQSESIRRMPSEGYEHYQLPPTATPADIQDAWGIRKDGSIHGFRANPAFWQTVIPVMSFAGDRLSSLALHPATLNLEAARPARGQPKLAGISAGTRILEGLQALSGAFDTHIDVAVEGDRAVGTITLP